MKFKLLSTYDACFANELFNELPSARLEDQAILLTPGRNSFKPTTLYGEIDAVEREQETS